MPLALTPPPTLTEQIAAVAREIAMRRRTYPRWVDQGRMRAERAQREIECMEAVLATLRAHPGAPDR